MGTPCSCNDCFRADPSCSTHTDSTSNFKCTDVVDLSPFLVSVVGNGEVKKVESKKKISFVQTFSIISLQEKLSLSCFELCTFTQITHDQHQQDTDSTSNFKCTDV